MTADSIAQLLAAADPSGPRALGGLIDRLRAAGRLRETRLDGRAIGAAALGPVEVHGVADDSRRIRPGDLFIAIPGGHTDGHDHVLAALGAGAAGSLVERPIAGASGPQIVVDRGPAALASAACWWFDDPSRQLGVVGVTGTDGKTTTSFLVTAVLEAAGIPTGLVGTVETQVGRAREYTAGHVTTPGAIELQRLLRAMVAAGDAAAVVETTSHGLAAERVAGTEYDAAIFTNLSHEHLEFHGSFDAYRAAKLGLFEGLGRPGQPKTVESAPGPVTPAGAPTVAPAEANATADSAVGRRRPSRTFPRLGVVNRDDPAGALFEAVTRESGARLLTYGTDPSADVRATSVEEDARRLRIGIQAPGWNGRIELALAGRFNVHNALAAFALGIGWELDGATIRAGLESVHSVPGRMDRIEAGQPFGVVVDYAHSPAALEKVLGLLAPVAAARGGGLIAVFGSAGERDLAKRPMMGRIAGERCRLVVLADEDPRGEDPMAILEAIAAGAETSGLHRGTDLLLIPDRRMAIEAAFERARPGDLVVLAGKGHESSIIGPQGPTPWDERAAALAALAALGHREE